MSRSGIIVYKNNFPGIGEKINEGVARAVRRAAIDIEQRAKALAPVDTGALREGIYTVTDLWNDYGRAVAAATALNPRAKILDPIQPVGPYEAGVGIVVDYWVANEFGTINRPARPFLTPAVEGARPQLEEDLKAALHDAH
jgi:HK97 gp10 family phage protein